MDINPTVAHSLYSYQAALAGGGQGSAILQALTQSYTSSSAANSSNAATDPLTALVGESASSPLVSAIYAQSQATGTSPSSLGITPEQLFGGLDSSSASALLTGLSSDAAAGLQGFDSAVTGSSSLASSQYAAQQAYGNGTLSSDAQAQANAEAAAANGTNTGDATAANSNGAAYVDQTVQAAQTAAINNTFSLLA